MNTLSETPDIIRPLSQGLGLTSMLPPSSDLDGDPLLVSVPQLNATDLSKVYDIVIVGGGPAGLTAGLYAARAGLSTLILEGEMVSATDIPGGQLMLTEEIENYPGFPGGSGYELVEIMRNQALAFGAEILTEAAYDYLLEGTPHLVYTTAGEYRAKAVILATGAVARRLGVKGEDEFFGRGVSTCATCDGAFFKDKVVAVVGGGDTAVEDALLLTNFASKVYLIHRRNSLRSTGPQARALLSHPKVEIIWDSSIESIHGSNNKVSSVTVSNLVDPLLEKEVTLDGVFIAVGHNPATESLLRNGYSVVELSTGGYIAVDGKTTKTNIEGVFAAGDVADESYRQAITAAASGCKALIDAHRWLIDVSA